MNITRENFPAGTRVVCTRPANEGLGGVVTGWHKDSIGVRWDNGGTHVAPAHFGGIELEEVAELEEIVEAYGRWNKTKTEEDRLECVRIAEPYLHAEGITQADLYRRVIQFGSECCDGTGWTGDHRAPCAEHYEPSGLSEFAR